MRFQTGEKRGKEEERIHAQRPIVGVYSFIHSLIGFWLNPHAFCLFLISFSLLFTKQICVNEEFLPANTDPFSFHFISEPVRLGALDQSLLIRARFNICC